MKGKEISEIVCYLDVGDGLMFVYTRRNSLSCTLRSLHFCMYLSKKRKRKTLSIYSCNYHFQCSSFPYVHLDFYLVSFDFFLKDTH